MTLDTGFLGLIALATVTMAVIQVAAIVYASRTVKQATAAMAKLQGDLAPILANARRATEDAARMTTMALVQVERVDAFVTSATARVDDTLAAVQEAIAGPLRKGSVLWAGLEALLAFFAARRGRKAPEDDDESLFIG